MDTILICIIIILLFFLTQPVKCNKMVKLSDKNVKKMLTNLKQAKASSSPASSLPVSSSSPSSVSPSSVPVLSSPVSAGVSSVSPSSVPVSLPSSVSPSSVSPSSVSPSSVSPSSMPSKNGFINVTGYGINENNSQITGERLIYPLPPNYDGGRLTRDAKDFPLYGQPMPDKYEFGRMFYAEYPEISYAPGFW
jgi:hypothetical protein